MPDVLVGERTDHHFGAGHFLGHRRHPSRFGLGAIKKAREGPCSDASLAAYFKAEVASEPVPVR
jgi:hypothetical protein